MKNIDILIQHIRKCNLQESEKLHLISLLTNQSINLDDFLRSYFTILKISKEILILFDIDIGD